MFIPFAKHFPNYHQYFLTIIDEKRGSHGKYQLWENYCIEKDCDCRKVILNITSARETSNILARIGYGSEPLRFYTIWLRGEKDIARDMYGAHLELGGRQLKYSKAFLQLIKKLTQDKKFTRRFREHYLLFKNMVDSYDINKP